MIINIFKIRLLKLITTGNYGKIYILFAYLFLAYAIFFNKEGICQSVDSLGFVEYTPEYEFKEGVYFTFDQVKENKPIQKRRIITPINYDDNEFFEKVLSDRKVYYSDILGNKKVIHTDEIWGYSRNGFIYIKLSNNYHRIIRIGAICHFVAMITQNTPSHAGFNGYMHPSASSNMQNPSTVVGQFLLDFKTGEIYEYTVNSVETLLKKDLDLYESFIKLRRKEKKKKKFVYIRKFNENNPIYFPVK